MLSVAKYPQDHVDQVRARIDADVAAYAALGLTDADFEARYFNNLAIVLDHSFVHRARAAEGKDGNPINEVRVIVESLIDHGGAMTPITAIKMKPERTVLKIAYGDEVKLTQAGFTALAAGFLAEVEARYA
jgi:hypothetical protein